MAESKDIGEITSKKGSPTGDALAIEQLKRYEDLVAKRKERDNDWQIIAQYALPQESTIVRQQTTESVAGWTDLIYDTTMIQAAETLAGVTAPLSRARSTMWLRSSSTMSAVSPAERPRRPRRTSARQASIVLSTASASVIVHLRP